MSFPKGQTCFINAAGLDEPVLVPSPIHYRSQNDAKVMELSEKQICDTVSGESKILINDFNGMENEKISYSDSLDSLSNYCSPMVAVSRDDGCPIEPKGSRQSFGINNGAEEVLGSDDTILLRAECVKLNVLSYTSCRSNVPIKNGMCKNIGFMLQKPLGTNYGKGGQESICPTEPKYMPFQTSNFNDGFSSCVKAQSGLMQSLPCKEESIMKLTTKSNLYHTDIGFHTNFNNEQELPTNNSDIIGISSSVSCDSLESVDNPSGGQPKLTMVCDTSLDNSNLSSESLTDNIKACNQKYEWSSEANEVFHSIPKDNCIHSGGETDSSHEPVCHSLTSFSQINNHASNVSINFVDKNVVKQPKLQDKFYLQEKFSTHCESSKKNFKALEHCSESIANLDNNSKMFNLFVRLDKSDSTDERSYKSVKLKNKDTEEREKGSRVLKSISHDHGVGCNKGSDSFFMFIDADVKNSEEATISGERKSAKLDNDTTELPRKSPGVYMYISADDMKPKTTSSKSKKPNIFKNIEANLPKKMPQSNQVSRVPFKHEPGKPELNGSRLMAKFHGNYLSPGTRGSFQKALVNEVDGNSLSSISPHMSAKVNHPNFKSYCESRVNRKTATVNGSSPNRLGDFVSLECLFDEVSQKSEEKMKNPDQFLNQLEALKTSGISKSNNSMARKKQNLAPVDFQNSFIFEKMDGAQNEDQCIVPVNERYNLLASDLHQNPSDILSAFDEISGENIGKNKSSKNNYNCNSVPANRDAKNAQNCASSSIENAPTVLNVVNGQSTTKDEFAIASELFKTVDSSFGPLYKDFLIDSEENGLLSKFLNQIDTDTLIETGGREIYAHSSVLRSRCPYFTAVLSGEFDDHVSSAISLTEYSHEAVKFVLCHIYGASEGIPSLLDIAEIADLANKLSLDNLKDLIADALESRYCHNFHEPCQRCIIGVVETLELADSYGLDGLGFKCLHWITQYFKKVWPTKYFIVLPENLLSRCYQYAVDQLSPQHVIFVMLDGIKLLRSLPRMKRSDTIVVMVNELMTETKSYVIERFSDVLSSASFQSLGKEESWNVNLLQDFLLDCCIHLQAKEACKSYMQLHAFKQTFSDDSNLSSFEQVVLKMHQQVENNLLQNASRVMTCPQWFCLNAIVQKKIKEAVLKVKDSQNIYLPRHYSSVHKNLSTSITGATAKLNRKGGVESFQDKELVRPHHLQLKQDVTGKYKLDDINLFPRHSESRSASISSSTSSERHNSRSPLSITSRARSSSASVGSYLVRSPNVGRRNLKNCESETRGTFCLEEVTDHVKVSLKSFSTSTFKKDSSSSMKSATLDLESSNNVLKKPNKFINSSTIVKDHKKPGGKSETHCDSQRHVLTTAKHENASTIKHNDYKRFVASKSFPSTPYRTNHDSHKGSTRIPTIDMKTLSVKKQETPRKPVPCPATHALLDPAKVTKNTSLQNKKANKFEPTAKSMANKEMKKINETVPTPKKTIPPMQRSRTFCKDSGGNSEI